MVNNKRTEGKGSGVHERCVQSLLYTTTPSSTWQVSSLPKKPFISVKCSDQKKSGMPYRSDKMVRKPGDDVTLEDERNLLEINHSILDVLNSFRSSHETFDGMLVKLLSCQWRSADTARVTMPNR